MIKTVTKIIDGWKISISDNGVTGKNKENKNKYNLISQEVECKIIGCGNTVRKDKQTGLCKIHMKHSHDLFLNVVDDCGNSFGAPAHKDIIDALLEWSQSRNFGLLPFFSDLSFNTLGNVPDVTVLAKEVLIDSSIKVPRVNEVFDLLEEVIERHFPLVNNSSYQPLMTKKGKVPAIVLAYIFAGLIICEEANRGDRWFCRMVIKDESKTTQLGAAMAIAYFATRIFPWGVEMNKSAWNLTK